MTRPDEEQLITSRAPGTGPMWRQHQSFPMAIKLYREIVARSA
jgi:hypothetical protein